MERERKNGTKKRKRRERGTEKEKGFGTERKREKHRKQATQKRNISNQNRLFRGGTSFKAGFQGQFDYYLMITHGTHALFHRLDFRSCR